MIHWHGFVGFGLGIAFILGVQKLWDYIFED